MNRIQWVSIAAIIRALCIWLFLDHGLLLLLTMYITFIAIDKHHVSLITINRTKQIPPLLILEHGVLCLIQQLAIHRLGSCLKYTW